MVSREDVLTLVASKGPIVPTDLTSDLKENSFIIGAILSELVANKKLFLSHAKFGGSPLYYLETQKAGLSKLYPHLNEKDRRAFDILKREIVLYDEPQTPLMRTALRGLKDFATPFKVTYKGKQLLYWKWYLASEEQVKEKINASLLQLFPAEEKREKEEVEEKKEALVTTKEQANKEKLIKKTEIKVEKTNHAEPEQVPKAEAQQKLPDVDNEQTKEIHLEDEFAIQVSGFLNSMNIKILNTEIIKKKKEIDFLIEVPSPVGSVKYFAKARNKKRSNEGDISTAFVEGQLHGLPVMYISTGDLPKKVDGIIAEKYKNLKVLKL